MLDTEAKYSPFGENTTLFIRLVYTVKVLMSYPLDIFHISIVKFTYVNPSVDPDAKYSSFGENTRVIALLEFTVKVLMSFPLDIFHTLISIPDPEAKNYPLDENTRVCT